MHIQRRHAQAMPQIVSIKSQSVTITNKGL